MTKREQKPKPRKTKTSSKPNTSSAVIVLGMHRSGTSALTRVLNLLGVNLGSELMVAVKDNNETGFWEHQGVVDQHEELMHQLGMRWDDPRAMPLGWIDRAEVTATQDRLATILASEFDGDSLWGVKDPRICRLLPIWRRILDARRGRTTIIHMVRHPLEIARSIERRDGLPRGRSLLLWLRHQIEAIKATDGLPQAWTSYDALMNDWRATMKMIERDLKLGLVISEPKINAEIDAFLTPRLRHHVLDGAALEADDDLAAWVGALYAETVKATLGETGNLLDTAAHIEAEIDRAAFYFDDTFAGWARVEHDLRDEITRRDRMIVERDESITEREGRIAERNGWVAERDRQVAERDGWVAERDRLIAERDRLIAERDKQIAELINTHNERVVELSKAIDLREREISDKSQHIANLETLTTELHSHLATILRSTSWRLTKPLRVLGRYLKTPRQYIRTLLTGTHTLTPSQSIDLTDLGEGRWESTDIHPVMMLHSDRGRLPRGWVELTYRLKADQIATPSLFADHGQGLSELDRKRLPPSTGTPVTSFLHLPNHVEALRFDPINWKGQFTLDPIQAREITRAGLAVRLLTRTLRDDGLGAVASRLKRSGLRGLKEHLARQATQSTENYETWRALYWALDDHDRKAIRAHIDTFEHRPTFSIILPTYETPEDLITRAIDSVRHQLYPNWELCIADDGSKSPALHRLLERYASEDNRIKVIFREANGHISAASNTALSLATGEWVALLDHDDELTEDALYWMANEILEHPDVDILYSDEDKIDEANHLSEPYFKPDWSPELFQSQNIINHLGVYRRRLVDDVDGFREGFEGSQDYDLALRVLERSSDDRIRHVPVVLYHWRTVAGSIALSAEGKTYAHDRARQAIMEHHERRGDPSKVIAAADGLSHRVVPPMPEPLPKVTIIVPTRDQINFLKMCVKGLRETTEYPSWELIIVDNGSVHDETLEFLDDLGRDDRIRILRDDGPFNFSRLNNEAAKLATGDLILMLNNDIEPIHSDWLSEMVRQLNRPGVGAVGAKLYYPDDTIQHCGVTVGIGGVAGHFEKRLPREANGYFNRPNLLHNASAVTAACLLTTKEIFNLVGGLDEENLAIAFNDVDFCLKIREAGYRIVVTPFAELYHHESISRGAENTPEKVYRFHREMRWMRERWADSIDEDPYFNPNLHLDNESPTLAFPPRVSKPWKRFKTET